MSPRSGVRQGGEQEIAAGDANGMLWVTLDCATLAEMEEEIEELRQELDEMVRQARRAFREHPAAGNVTKL